MTRPDIFRLEKSGLNRFLFAGIGIEANGSPLSVLSVLARLGHDPWMTALRWAAMPRADAIGALTACIVQMPLSARDITNASATADRLVRLLFGAASPFADAITSAKHAGPATMPATLLAHMAIATGLVLCLLFVATLVSRLDPAAPVDHPHAETNSASFATHTAGTLIPPGRDDR